MPARTRGATLVEVLIALAIGSAVLVVAMSLWMYASRAFVRVQTTQELQTGARIVAESMLRDIAAAHLVLRPDDPCGAGVVLRLIRYPGQDARDLASRADPRYIDGDPPAGDRITRQFRAQRVTYRFDPRSGTVTRREEDGTWRWEMQKRVEVTRVDFAAEGEPRELEIARNMTQVCLDYLGWVRSTGKLDRVGNIAEPDRPYAGVESLYGATALVLVRLTCRVEQPERVGDSPEMQLLTKAWCERRRLDGLARPYRASTDETPAR